MLLYYCHIPKAGGQTINRMIRLAFGRSKCLRVWEADFGSDISPLQFMALQEPELKKYRAVCGHLAFSYFLSNPAAKRLVDEGEVVMTASVREPIDRIVSQYNYVTLHPAMSGSRFSTSLSLDDYALAEPENSQSRYLSSEETESPDLERIFGDFTVFTLEHSISGMRQVLKDEFGLSTKAAKIKNKSSGLADGRRVYTRDDLAPATLKKLNEKHGLDLELFRRASSQDELRVAAKNSGSWLWKRFGSQSQ